MRLLTGEIDLLNDCNLHCVMCERWKWPKNAELEFNVLKKHVLEDYAVQGVSWVLSGGEPLKYYAFEDLMDYFINRKTKFWLITNGTEADINYNKLLEAAFTIRVSLDAAIEDLYKKVRGDKFNEVMTFMDKLTKAKYDNNSLAQIVITAVLHKYTFTQNNVEALFKLANNYKAELRFYLVRVYEHLWPTINELKLDFPLINKVKSNLFKTLNEYVYGYPVTKYCHLIDYNAHIDFDGNIYACCLLASSVSKIDDRQYCYGNIYDLPLKTILQNSHHIKNTFRNNGKMYPKECEHCEVFYTFNQAWNPSVHHAEIELDEKFKQI